MHVDLADSVMPSGSIENLRKVLRRTVPSTIPYAPNYWQWFEHHRAHQTLPRALQSCDSQVDMIRALGLDVFSRNCYMDQTSYWFGGLCEEIFEGVHCSTACSLRGQDKVTVRSFETARGMLSEQFRYVWSESTVVQDVFLVDDPGTQLKALEVFVQARRWRFNDQHYLAEQARVGDDGLVIAGELFSPLKMLHLVLGPVQTIYLVTDYPESVQTLCDMHEAAQLDLVRQMAEAGVPAMMSMDNLDSVFHPPHYVEAFSASFYEKASRICHEHGSTFFIHACGQQRANLKRISALGVDGLEGVAYPPLGDVSLVEAMEMTGDRFIITGGISAAEFETLKTKAAVFQYVKMLFQEMWPYRHRFVLSASCNTPINASYEQVQWFRAAWEQYKEGQGLSTDSGDDIRGASPGGIKHSEPRETNPA